jgi:hypothetical protein
MDGVNHRFLCTVRKVPLEPEGSVKVHYLARISWVLQAKRKKGKRSEMRRRDQHEMCGGSAASILQSA